MHFLVPGPCITIWRKSVGLVGLEERVREVVGSILPLTQTND